MRLAPPERPRDPRVATSAAGACACACASDCAGAGATAAAAARRACRQRHRLVRSKWYEMLDPATASLLRERGSSGSSTGPSRPPHLRRPRCCHRCRRRHHRRCRRRRPSRRRPSSAEAAAAAASPAPSREAVAARSPPSPTSMAKISAIRARCTSAACSCEEKRYRRAAADASRAREHEMC